MSLANEGGSDSLESIRDAIQDVLFFATHDSTELFFSVGKFVAVLKCGQKEHPKVITREWAADALKQARILQRYRRGDDAFDAARAALGDKQDELWLAVDTAAKPKQPKPRLPEKTRLFRKCFCEAREFQRKNWRDLKGVSCNDFAGFKQFLDTQAGEEFFKDEEGKHIDKKRFDEAKKATAKELRTMAKNFRQDKYR